jgi:hypothetical protein
MPIKFNDPAPGGILKPREKKRRAGATCLRPAFDALEALDLMHAGIGGAVMAPIPQAAHVLTAKSTEQEAIRKKLAQIRQVVAVLQQMDVRDLSPAQWLAGQSRKNLLLMEADQTELMLKRSEIRKLESLPEKATILTAEKAELAIMEDKMARMTQLQPALEHAGQRQPGAEMFVADVILAISHDELRLKNQQVVSLREKVRDSAPDEQPALLKLLDGEQYEVKELTQVCTLNREIVAQIERGGVAAKLAGLRRRVLHHELLVKEQNERQLEARLKS